MEEAIRLVDSTSRQTENRAKVTAPVDTGLLRGNHRREVYVERTAAIGIVYNITEYALPVHEGWERTAPIVPKKGKALKFKINGQTVIVSRVNSPASARGRPWLRLALYATAPPRGFIVRSY